MKSFSTAPLVALPLALLVAAVFAAPADAQQRRGGELMMVEHHEIGSGGSLAMDLGDANIEIETGGSRVEVEVIAHGQNMEWAEEVFERMQFEVTRSGNSLRIEAREPRITGDEWRRNRGAGVTAIVTVPERFDLALNTGDGNITVGSIQGHVELISGDGNLTVEAVTSDHAFMAETSDGNITVRRAEAPRIELLTRDGNVTTGEIVAEDTRIRTQDGNVTVDGSRGRIALSTGDGNVNIQMDDFAGAELVSGDGNVIVSAPADLAADVDLTGERLSIDGFAIDGRVQRRSARGSIGGGGPSLSARTSDGRVALTASRR